MKKILPTLALALAVTAVSLTGADGVASRSADPFIGVKGRTAFLVTEVTGDAPAAAAGLRVGDLVVELNGEPLRSFDHLSEVVRATAPGDEVEVGYLRSDPASGQYAQATVTVEPTELDRFIERGK
jgi:S1-C subfamily serine protease